MSARPGYDDLVAQRGREVADRIIASAETCSDSAHQPWEDALRWAIEQRDWPADPELARQQEENGRLSRELAARRGDDSRPILYLAIELGGDAYDHPFRLARAESILDAEGWRLPPDATMREQLDWAIEQARGASLGRPS